MSNTKKRFNDLSKISDKSDKKKDVLDIADDVLSSKPMNIVQTYDFFLSEKSPILKMPFVDKLPDTARYLDLGNSHHAVKNIITLNKAGNTVSYVDKLPNTAPYFGQEKISL
jgi:hypothetical protein